MPVLSIAIGWDPDITRIGGFLLTWHGLFTSLSILVGVQLSLRLAKRVGYDYDDMYALVLVGVPSGIIGARALFVLENWDFFGDNPGQILALTEGGITVYGAILGGIGGAVVFGLIRGFEMRRALDIAAPGIILGQAIGRIGDLVNGEHLARATDLPWGVVYTNREAGAAFSRSLEVGPVHPAVTYEMLGDLVILAALLYVLFRVFWRYPGLTFFTYFVSYAVMRFFLTYLRVDSAYVLDTGLRVPQFISLLVILVSIPGIWYFATRTPLPPRSEVVEEAVPAGRVPVRQARRRRNRRGR